LRTLDEVGGVERWHLYWAARADLLRQLDRDEEAALAYRTALELEMNDSDRRFLARRLADL
jgi:RNA polymerase sigma-70 factor (ECF subfamily)